MKGTMFIEGDDLFVDVDYLESQKEELMKWGPWGRPYDGLVLGFGKNVFVFSVRACPIIKQGETKTQ